MKDRLLGALHNLPPIMLVFLTNLLIVFKIVRIPNLILKIVIDAVISIIGVSLVNYLYAIIYGELLLEVPPRIDRAGTVTGVVSDDFIRYPSEMGCDVEVWGL